ncbi:MAG: erythromycin esterase family protein [Clostridiales bacterium]|jgi:erythromycin esterase|nr:erythromycin esterase family protein [Clostridiales bacterium]
MFKKYFSFITVLLIYFFVFSTFENTTLLANNPGILYNTAEIKMPQNVKIVGLGESSHGVKEYHQMKLEVFQALVKNNGCRIFIIEGDFGGALKVDAYIHGSEGTAEEVVSEIGFAIYRTQEMADLVEWMRKYNETAPSGKDLHFYGMDMQRYDNNKEYLFSVLDKSAPDISAKYKAAFAGLTDASLASLSAEALNKAKAGALSLSKDMALAESKIVAQSGQEAFDFALECANTIYECSELIGSNNAYSTIRDKNMAAKVDWFLQHSGGMVFINGHNGHIGKTSVSGYTCLGELLKNKYGENYFAIGTDASSTNFNSQNDNGSFTKMGVNNTNALSAQLNGVASNYYYLDFTKLMADETWQPILSNKQTITSLNVGIYSWQKLSKAFYTQTITPKDEFNGMIVFKQVSPTTLIK